MDLFVANLDRENFAIYRNNRDETFDDLALPTGIAKATRFMSGWGLNFLTMITMATLICSWPTGTRMT